VLAVIAVGTWELAQGAVSLGGLLVFLTFLTRLYTPIRGIAALSNSVYSASAAAERIIECFDQRSAVLELPDAAPLARVRGAITFDRVSFTYPASTRSAISELSFHVNPGEMVALVGASGAGKSSIAKLLLRFYDPSAGHVLLDGMDLRDVSLNSLRDHVAVVLQETLIFDGTIRENIAYGRLDATEADILAAAEAAHVDHFVRTLPDGYDTVIDDDASNLSAGEKQLLTIARAFLADPPILILDEATSSVDTRTEVLIQRAMTRLMRGRTTFVIAHRLSTIRDADTILVMDRGHIVEQGDHDALLARRGFYHELYNSQFAEALVEAV
jgi:ABC-type multidrug transport system fused ATPase/permease subunit